VVAIDDVQLPVDRQFLDVLAQAHSSHPWEDV
jgi:hypothetical protein